MSVWIRGTRVIHEPVSLDISLPNLISQVRNICLRVVQLPTDSLLDIDGQVVAPETGIRPVATLTQIEVVRALDTLRELAERKGRE